ncbi:hypothetical protein C922_05467 [Plasmodium inui San Antonio 1]|uniref:Uncharacterized protein n=1 Tax=Plasmodium inui San Antonio 1 TaxID=1237626 RepID=W7AFS8_9APIC|nr:hypothetical protein C922_05467 [Plasmodium inui San Antonio 1]EUD64151.1 hypothetical protein C922_05467 [Plasmodium inui San Antonio 1]
MKSQMEEIDWKNVVPFQEQATGDQLTQPPPADEPIKIRIKKMITQRAHTAIIMINGLKLKTKKLHQQSCDHRHQ